ncbi:hypothetical protein QQS21_004517 [Conoideocrella luteorostrata]|uniref:Uncharacterized protein n=1 Tax=Conoideocrella luteorostrata TaxID=1105319 RepID=A0AAJ0CU42_9HYPO|nr:hypothetical protein QQS21_004517 [Conoideocrella luteorostrata]
MDSASSSSARAAPLSMGPNSTKSMPQSTAKRDETTHLQAPKRKHQHDHDPGEPSKLPRVEAADEVEVEEEDEDEEEEEQEEEKKEREREREEEPSHWRAVMFFHDMIQDPANTAPKYNDMDREQKLIFALGARNLYLATAKGATVRERDRQILKSMLDVMDEIENPVAVDGLDFKVSFYPTKRYSQLRRVEELDKRIDERCEVRNYFAQLVSTPRVFAVFAKPE